MNREIKDAIYSQLSIITKALSSPKRLEIIELLSQGEKSVEAIAEQAGLGIKNSSAQLKELKSAGLVNSRRDGKFVYYRLADDSITDLWRHLSQFAQGHLGELQKIMVESLSAPEALEQISRKELLLRAKRKEIILIDVRPNDEYEAAHLPFAMSIPASDITKHLRSLPKNKEIVAYCRGPYCFLAKEAVEVLSRKGFKARRLQDSVHDWKSYGLSLEGKNVNA
jgi:DNA-binding transcriptional ArsR family regulator